MCLEYTYYILKGNTIKKIRNDLQMSYRYQRTCFAYNACMIITFATITLRV